MTTQGTRQHLLGALHPWVHFLYGGYGTPLLPVLILLHLTTTSLDKNVTKSIESQFIADKMHQCTEYY